MTKKNDNAADLMTSFRPANEGVIYLDDQGKITGIEWFHPLIRDLLADFFQTFTGQHINALFPVFSSPQLGAAPKSAPSASFSWKKLSFTASGKLYPATEQEQNAQKKALCFIRIHQLKNTEDNKFIIEPLYDLHDIITVDPQMLQLKEEIRLLSDSDSNTLIYGETGTGKELMAEAIHSEGKRRHHPFISQNCAAIPENLMEGLLFGTEKGSFTGAETKPGLFEQADGGTLFLDELNSMDIGLQAKLLKIIEQGKSRRIGGSHDYYFNVRLIVATNEIPEKLVLDDRLRRDLYYRLNIARISIPPLRKRKEDIPVLSYYFIRQLNRKMNKQIKGLTPDAEKILMACEWPGNVRQLENVLESAFNLETSPYISGSIIQNYLGQSELGEKKSTSSLNTSDSENSDKESLNTALDLSSILIADTIDLNKVLKEYEAAIISAVLDEEENISAAARRLQMSPQKLNYRIKVLNLHPDKARSRRIR